MSTAVILEQASKTISCATPILNGRFTVDKNSTAASRKCDPAINRRTFPRLKITLALLEALIGQLSFHASPL